MENTRILIKWVEEGKLRPHIHKIYKLEDTSRALEEMADRKVKGKLVVQV